MFQNITSGFKKHRQTFSTFFDILLTVTVIISCGPTKKFYIEAVPVFVSHTCNILTFCHISFEILCYCLMLFVLF